MKALIAFDKFKDALSAQEICSLAAESLLEAKPNWQHAIAPLADGGDGFCDTLTNLANGVFHKVTVSGPLGHDTEASYGLIELANVSTAAFEALDFQSKVRTLAIVELAQSSGIALIPQASRSPWITNTYGLGQAMADAIDRGADAILVGLGGSSSNDLGLGALQALGFHFLNSNGERLEGYPIPNAWDRIATIQKPDSEFTVPIRIACDVENPLLGSNGAAAIFGPQKGLKPEDFDSLDSKCSRLAKLLCDSCQIGHEALNTKGTGAAGGTAFGLMVGLKGRILSGAELVFAWSNLEVELSNSDIVITGEGRFDASSLQGKGPGSLAIRAAEAGKKVYVLAGSIGSFEEELHPNISLIPISAPNTPIEVALSETGKNLRAAISKTFG